ncbi:branched-chain amino acid ABC transporter permease [Bosea sp. (in: a-proteobacteria)]|jgi:branched-chain amino acid transport system permease protein|uniref:branched-chain amino acid ABC transporter permease n=1 Tax=Bosea sp. (in: a-proteobacteria) TaxID=1871050 RepID=UPI002DDDA0AC|nr:branched-chain amino acid ABC transporter permease [Bosea sp. (in: a-proteobacteria)]HEV2510326.1 branched-chain amino acid ABC transporter permease [Bosea sp. (in: a-proteobacteria)]
MTLTLLVQSIIAGLTNGFVYGLIGLGIAVVFRGSRIINAMQGDVALIGAVVAYIIGVSLGLPMFAGFLLGIVAGGLTGFLVDRFMIRPTAKRRGTEDSFLLVTLGGAFAVSATVLLYFGRDSYILPGVGGNTMVDVFDAAMRVHAIWLIAISTFVVFGLRWFYTKTTVGQAMLAASIDPEGATTLGINVSWMRALTFGLGGLVGGLAGVLVAPLINIQYEMGLLLTLKGFAAAILGGLTSPFGAIFGGVLLGLVEALAVVTISSGYKDVVSMTLLIAIMIVRPQGLFGSRGRLGG